MSEHATRTAHLRVSTGGSPPSIQTLPTWPLTLLLVGFPVWWLVGVLDFVWVPFAVIMAGYMVQRRQTLAPRGFGGWLLFLVCATCAVIGLTQAPQLLVFGYRLANYVACTIVFLYVFNSRKTLTDRFVTGTLTLWWLIVVAGGYIALMFPTGAFRTPVSMILPGWLLSNSWVRLMVIRPLNQYNPDSYFQLDPRPSAPFVYTNQWGSVYSLLLPFVIAYLINVRGTRRFWWIAAALPVSFVPAILTTNRGMLLGIAVGAVYAAGCMLFRRDVRGILALGVAAAVAALVAQLLPISDRLETRSAAPSILDRASLYLQSLDVVKDSPFFGYGRTLTVPGSIDPVGTQGEFWIVLVSYGVLGVLFFVGWFIFAFIRSIRWQGSAGLAASTVLLVGTVQFFYYGAVPHTLPLIMIAAALALRTRTQTSPRNRARYIRNPSYT